MANKFFDTHTHMDAEQFDADRDEAIMRAFEAGVRKLVNVGCDMESSRKSIEMSEKYPFVYAAVGVHPHDADNYSDEAERELEELLKHPKAVALGEIGLDYYYDFSPRERQKEVFKRQMELAERTGKKVIIHSREATADTLEIMKMYPDVKGVVHCYSGSLETAREILKMGYMISFTGVLTYNNAVKAVQCVKELPLDRIMAETDSPYLTPVPFRGRRNESMNVGLVVRRMAEIREMDIKELSEIIYENSERFYFSKDEE